MSGRTQTTDMTQGNALRYILTFAVPLLIGTVFQQLYSFFDTMSAGRNLGDHAIAAIGASGAIYSLIISIANGLNSGYGLILSRAFGAKDMFLNLDTFFFFPLSILLVLRTTLQSLGRKVVPVVSSVIELAMKVVACLWLIPTWGYLGVAMTEPISWVLCAAMLGVVYVRSKHDLSTLNLQNLQEE